MGVERTFVMLKPDAVERGLVGQIISRFEAKGLKVVALKMVRLSREAAEAHYRVHKGKHFFDDLVNFICSGPVVAMILEGREAVKTVRQLVGATDPVLALPGTIRGDLATEVTRNLVHAADSLEAAEREWALFFPESGV
ncbi:MAG: nucleoside-diphosphate kinase [Bacillota bacterium]